MRNFYTLLLLVFSFSLTAQILRDNSCSPISTNFSLDWDATPTASQFNWTPQGSTTFTANNIAGTGNSISFALSGATGTLTSENSVSTPGITNSLSGGVDALHISSSGLTSTQEIELTMTFTPALAGNISFDIYNIIELAGGGSGGQQIEVFGLTSTGFAIVPELSDNGTPSWELEGPGVVDGNATSIAGTNDQMGVNFKSISDIETIHVILRRCSGCGNAANTEFAISDIDICLTPDTDQDGVPDTEDGDDDNDGIFDVIEKCPASAPTTADWDNYTYNDGDPSNTYALPDGTNMTVAVGSNGASLVAGETNSDLTGGNGAGTVGLFLNGNQNLQVNSIDVTFKWDQAIDDLSYTIFDVDQLGGQYVDSLTIIGFYDGFVVFPAMTGSANNTITQNRAVGDASTADNLATANVDVSFSEPIDSMVIFYGNGSNAPAAPGNQWITIWDFTYVGDCGTVDNDGDGVPDYLDIDADNDGIVDVIERQGSTATPIIPAGSDADNDGIDDNFEALGPPIDTDGDGVPDFKDPDTDNDGDLDLLEGWDTDNDGVANITPSGLDADGDGLDDNFDNVSGFNSTTNVTNNGQDSEDFPNLDETLTAERDWREDPDIDDDGIADYEDIDDDNDGILDVNEGKGSNNPNGDEDGDGIQNWADVSDAGNGGDGSITDYTDGNGDGIPDVFDADNDGIPNHHDPDADGDGIADIIEAGGVDTDGNGIVDGVFADNDNDGWSDVFDPDAVTPGTPLTDIDQDGDGLQNHLDIDADNDGIVDIIESQPSGALTSPSGTDSDNDGIDDNFDTDEGNSLNTPENTDVTDNPDYLDTNSDNDVDSDLIEGWDTNNDGSANTTPAGTDSDNDGLDDNFDNVVGQNSTTNVTNNGQTSASFPDLDTPGGELDWRDLNNTNDNDGDGIVNDDDIDDDNDGILDVDEGCLANTSSPSGSIVSSSGVPGGDLPLINNGDFSADNGVRINSVGEFMVIDLGGTIPSGTIITISLWKNNTSNKEIRIAQLTNSTAVLGGGTNGQTVNQSAITGVTAYQYTLTTATQFLQIEMTIRAGGRIEVVEATVGAYSDCTQDTDNDGVIDAFDPDSDGDGIADIVEAGGTDTDGNGIVDGTFTDTDGDGWSNEFDSDNGGTALTDGDQDSDGLENRIDLDSDDDGIIDIIESQPSGTLITPTGNDDDGDGIDDAFDPNSGNTLTDPENTDGTDNPDYLDTDADNDGDSDAIEGWDIDNDGVADTSPIGTDSDNDGIDDNYDIAIGPNSTTNVTNNGQSSASFPNFDVSGTPELDWREDKDFDGDGIVDIDDIDDDNDGVLDVNECQGSVIFEGGFEGIPGVNNLNANNLGVTITPWILTSGGTNVIAVDGPGGGTYGIGGPEVDARGDAGNYFDINGTGQIYQTFTLTSTQTVFYEGFFSARDGDTGNGEISILAGTGVAGAVQSTSGVITTSDNTAWTYVSDTVTLTAGTYSFVVDMGNPINFDEGGISIICDTDNDNIPDQFDLDSDGDGIADIIEAGGVDADGNGIVDDETDTDNDGWADTFDPTNGGTELVDADTDGDGLENRVDIDADNDGIVDIIESQPSGVLISPSGNDTDGDGIDDNFDSDLGNTLTSPVNTDAADNPDYTDTNSDNDLQNDNIEGWDTDNDGTAETIASGTDSDNDGLDDSYDNIVGPNNTTNITNGGQSSSSFPNLDVGSTSERDWREIKDTDGDNIADEIDIDDDDDGILDVDEGGGSNNPVGDEDGDGILNFEDVVDNGNGGDGSTTDYTDNDNNGIPDVFDPDGDAISSHLDLDADGDGIADIIEAGGIDSNGDGRVDDNTDSDNDGWANTFDSDNGGTALAEEDTDGDGFENYVDLDSDSDGLSDNLEGLTTAGFRAFENTDIDADGWDDEFDGNVSGGTNGTPINLSNNEAAGEPDYRDNDSDGDGIPDWIEGFDDDEDGDALNDLLARTNQFNLSGGDPTFYVIALDTDVDGIPNYLEDDDLNGVPNFLDPSSGFYNDTDNDGLVDLYDPDNSGAIAASPDTDGDGEYDFRDLDDQTGGLPVELLSFEAKKHFDDVQLDWTTVTEINNDYFEIQRLTVNGDFERIGQVNGVGNSSEINQYRFIDLDPIDGENYYRLKQVDFDGTRSFSRIRMVKFQGSAASSSTSMFSIVPNPNNGEKAYFNFSEEVHGEFNWLIIDSKGNQIKECSMFISENNAVSSIEILQETVLIPGIYYIKLQHNTDFYNEIMIVQ